MNDEGFTEHWAAHYTRRMEECIARALRSQDPEARRQALTEAMDLGREARLRIEATSTQDAAERVALSHLESALDEVQAALNAYDICYDPLLRVARQQAAEAADNLARSGR